MMLSEIVVYLDEVGSLEPNAITVPATAVETDCAIFTIETFRIRNNID